MNLTTHLQRILSLRYTPDLIPSDEVCHVINDNKWQWEATGINSRFRLDIRFPLGWLEVSYWASSERETYFELAVPNDSQPEQSFKIGLVSAREKSFSGFVYVGKNATQVLLRPGVGQGRFTIRDFRVRNVTRLEIVSRTAWNFFFKSNIPFFESAFIIFTQCLALFRDQGLGGIIDKIRRVVAAENGYDLWIKSHMPTPTASEQMAQNAESLSYQPVFSVLLPVHNLEERWLRCCIDSVIAQVYPCWELCLVGDASTRPHVCSIMEDYTKRDTRINVVYRETAGHISAAANSAPGLATGDFMCLIDDNDEISPEALFEFAALLNKFPETDMIYSDEDRIDANGRRFGAFFKPDWSPEYLEEFPYTSRLACYRMNTARRIGGLRVGYEEVEEYDFILRFVEQTQKILHVPRILYHARVTPQSGSASVSAKNPVRKSAVTALKNHLERLNITGTVKPLASLHGYDVRREISGNPLISIIIPTAGRSGIIFDRQADFITNCVNSIHDKSTYRHYQIIVVGNGDLNKYTLRAIESVGCKLVHFKEEFNFAKEINLGARYAEGEYLLFLNDDTEVISPDWLEAMLQLLQRPGVGAVGGKLYFPSGKIQHVGVVLRNGLPYHPYRGSPGTSPGYFLSSVVDRNYLAVTGACMMTKRDLFQKIGGWDEDFAVNYNDIDYCLKLKETGYRTVFTPHARLYHFESQSRDAGVEPEEMERFQQLWRSRLTTDPYYPAQLSLLTPWKLYDRYES